MTWFDYLRHLLEHYGELAVIDEMLSARWSMADALVWLEAEQTGRTRLHTG